MNQYNRNDPSEKDAFGDAISWIIAFIMMFAFFPIGLFLLFRKLRKSAKYVEDGTGAGTGAWAGTNAGSGSRTGAGAGGAASAGAGTGAGAWTGSKTGAGTGTGTGTGARGGNSTGAGGGSGSGAGAGYERQRADGRYTEKARYTAQEFGSAAKQTAVRAAQAARESSYAMRQAAKKAGTAAREAGYAMHQAAREAGASVRDSGNAMRQAAGRRADYANNTNHTNNADYTDYDNRTKHASHTTSGFYGDATRDFYTPPKTSSKKKKDNTPLGKKSGKFVSALLLLISIPMFIIGSVGIGNAIQGFLSNSPDRWIGLILGTLFLTGAFTSFFSRNVRVRRFARYKNYFAYAAGHDIVSIPDLARAAGVSAGRVKRDVKSMISDGYFGPGAYLDFELNSLVLVPEAAKEVREAARAGNARNDGNDLRNNSQKTTPVPDETPANPYMSIILELRQLNVSIADITISDKIYRIEEVTAKIFRIVEENPEKQPQIRRFMNYYLPTTLKLLHSYATLEKQGIRGENITSAKENIGRVLDTLATGFEQQLDQLFKSDAIDIAADITVLENLMQQDGLTGDKPELKVMEGSGF